MRDGLVIELENEAFPMRPGEMMTAPDKDRGVSVKTAAFLEGFF